MPNNFDIKQDLRDRIQRLINMSHDTPVMSLTAFSQQDMCGIDRVSLDQLMCSITTDYQHQGYTVTYDADSHNGCQVNICKSSLSCNSPGGKCAIDFSMRRFKRATSTYESATLDFF
jgi:hypothetical protein